MAKKVKHPPISTLMSQIFKGGETLTENIVKLLKAMYSPKFEEAKPVIDDMLFTCTQMAFANAKPNENFVADVLEALEAEDFDFDRLEEVQFYFQNIASHVIEEDHQWVLLTIPFLASSSYGLPHGKMPEAVTEGLYKAFKAILPQSFSVRINSDILNTDHFLMQPVEMHRKIAFWAKNFPEGVSTFYKSDEETQDVNDLVADIRVIAVIIGAGKQHSLSMLENTNRLGERLQERVAKHLYASLRENYLGTKIELIAKHSPAMQDYLKRVMIFGERHLELLMGPPGILMAEAGKLFRPFAFKEALNNLLLTFSLKLEDLQFTIGNFYESPAMGLVIEREIRIGISKKDDKHNVLQGITWPLFFDGPRDSLNTLLNVMRDAEIEPTSILLLERTNFMIEDDDEPMAFPAFDGDLHEPQPPEGMQAPVNFLLN